MILEWSERFSLHHKMLDAQHQELFNLANAVHALDPATSSKAELSKLFKAFYDYMAKHFKEEEAYMQSLHYPLFIKHQKLHQSIIEGMNKILKEEKSIEGLQEKMKFISQKWLMEHILENDLKIEAWRKSITLDENEFKSLH